MNFSSLDVGIDTLDTRFAHAQAQGKLSGSMREESYAVFVKDLASPPEEGGSQSTDGHFGDYSTTSVRAATVVLEPVFEDDTTLWLPFTDENVCKFEFANKFRRTERRDVMNSFNDWLEDYDRSNGQVHKHSKGDKKCLCGANTGLHELHRIFWACLDEGLSSLCLPHSRLYGESL